MIGSSWPLHAPTSGHASAPSMSPILACAVMTWVSRLLTGPKGSGQGYSRASDVLGPTCKSILGKEGKAEVPVCAGLSF